MGAFEKSLEFSRIRGNKTEIQNNKKYENQLKSRIKDLETQLLHYQTKNHEFEEKFIEIAEKKANVC